MQSRILCRTQSLMFSVLHNYVICSFLSLSIKTFPVFLLKMPIICLFPLQLCQKQSVLFDCLTLTFSAICTVSSSKGKFVLIFVHVLQFIFILFFIIMSELSAICYSFINAAWIDVYIYSIHIEYTIPVVVNPEQNIELRLLVIVFMANL